MTCDWQALAKNRPDHGLVVRELQRRAAMAHLFAEAIEAELQDVEA